MKNSSNQNTKNVCKCANRFVRLVALVMAILCVCSGCGIINIGPIAEQTTKPTETIDSTETPVGTEWPDEPTPTPVITGNVTQDPIITLAPTETPSDESTPTVAPTPVFSEEPFTPPEETASVPTTKPTTAPTTKPTATVPATPTPTPIAPTTKQHIHTLTVGADGKTTCSSCHKEFIKEINGDYCRTELAKMSNGANYVKFYDRVMTTVLAFEASSNNATADGGYYRVATIKYSDCGITTDEMHAVYKMFLADNPGFFWISQSYNYSQTMLYINADAMFANGATRRAAQTQVYNAINNAADIAKNEDDAYMIALAFHDYIISLVDYAYDSKGVPEHSLWAHSIYGPFNNGKVVCDGYSKLFQVFMNYFNIPNVFVVGDATGESSGHAWNLIKLSSGWYWCDLTWDDHPGFEQGIDYKFFCVTDSQDTNWYDFSWEGGGTHTFISQHTTDLPTGVGSDFFVTLPTRATGAYAGENKIRKTFTVDNITFITVGFYKVQITYVNKTGEVVLPESVNYGGRTYDVIAIGGADKTKLVGDSKTQVFASGITKVTIPASIEYIYDYALTGAEITEYIVASDNPVYKSVDGVVFTKNLYTLVAYPNANSRESYALPDSTRHIALGAFKKCSSLTTLTLGRYFTAAGVYNIGMGYDDSDADKASHDFYVSEGAIVNIFYSLANGAGGIIKVSNQNQNFKVDNGIIYALDENDPSIYREIVGMAQRGLPITELVIPSSVTKIGTYAFFYTYGLKTVSIPSSVMQVGSSVFAGSQVNTIKLAANAVPSTWSETWQANNSATITYGVSF